MQKQFTLSKMRAQNEQLVRYFITMGDTEIEMNQYIGKKIKIEFTGKIQCLGCGREIRKSFHQGYCYTCLMTLPETAPCILNPELCEAHLGIWRNKEWSEKNCLSPHFVYLSNTGNLKVGVTRESQIPTRWIDQGASQAIIAAKTPNRFTAGQIEVALKKIFYDKTNWQRMLKTGGDISVDLQKEKQKLKTKLSPDFMKYFFEDNTITEFKFPITNYPEKILPFNIEKEKIFEGTLNGIKAQYLILESGKVLNIRKFGAYEVIFSAPSIADSF